MKEALEKVKSAVSQKDVVAHLTHYLIAGGQIVASDGRMTAGAPFPDQRTFLVPAEDFEKVVMRLGKDPVITLEENAIVVKAGRYRATVRTLDPAQYHYQLPEGECLAVPGGFLDRLRAVRPFVSDNATQPWSLCVHCTHERLAAANNICAAISKDSGLPPGTNALLPIWAVDYVLSRKEGLTGLHISANSMAFRWADGSWMRTQLVAAEFPTQLDKMLGETPEPDWEIPADWREAYARVADLTDDAVRLHGDRIVGGRADRTTVEGEAFTPVHKEDGHTTWNPKFLTPVIEAATHWKPDAYPRPAPFRGRLIFGLIMGRSD